MVLDFIKDAIYEHDNGKINKEFQNKINGEKVNGDSSHSCLSAYLYLVNKIDRINDKYKNKRVNKILKNFAIHISYLISRHHSNLEDFDYDMYFSKLSNYTSYKDINFDINDIYNCCNGLNENIYILNKLIYSILTTCDTIASYEFETDNTFDFATIDNDIMTKYKNTFENNNIIKSIRNKTVNTGINEVRSEIFLKAEQRVSDSNISFLEAQTGSGKTITSLGMINKLLNNKYKKIVYTAPYKTILFQTEKTIANTLSDNYIIKNEDTEIFVDLNDINYDRDVLNDTLLNSNIIITSHVKLFDILFSHKKANVMGLYGLMDSIIVLDEIQAYNNVKWIQIINLLAQYSRLLNIKFIIMSATLPKLDKLLENDIQCDYILAPDEVDTYRKFFNKRVRTDFSMLDIPENEYKLEIIYENIDKRIAHHKYDKKFLIGLIKNKTSYMFYQRFKEKYKNYDVLLLNGDSTQYARKKVIERINDKNNDKKVILIATQTIEAGVDISMDVGFKDFGILDSDIQFKGRIARNFEKEGTLYIFDYDDYKTVYRDDLRKKYTLADKKGQEMFITENFEDVYNANFNLLERKSKLEEINKYCKQIQFETVDKEMKLIEQNNIQILINTPKANKLHNELKDICNIKDFSKKKIMKRKKKIEMKDYMLKYNVYGEKYPELPVDDKTHFYILDDYEKYIEYNDFGNIFYMNILREDLEDNLFL